MVKKIQSKNLKTTGVAAFLEQVSKAPINKRSGSSGRLIFAMDATASRQFTWDWAAQMQTEMFLATSEYGELSVQLAFFRGFGEFRVSHWTNSGVELKNLMGSVNCSAGITQIGKVLQHALNETKIARVNAVVFVGDSMEEDVDVIADKAGQLGVFGVPVFIFQEGDDAIANYAFNEISRLSGGASVRFDISSVDTLRELLRAVAVYATGGADALRILVSEKGGQLKLLTQRILKK